MYIIWCVSGVWHEMTVVWGGIKWRKQTVAEWNHVLYLVALVFTHMGWERLGSIYETKKHAFFFFQSFQIYSLHGRHMHIHKKHLWDISTWGGKAEKKRGKNVFFRPWKQTLICHTRNETQTNRTLESFLPLRKTKTHSLLGCSFCFLLHFFCSK